ncbi:glucose 1-dehydrogenase [Rubrobacter marinus]|uniref:Glucose 1-dehydrogenase n=1 Tax=Rubrobacter marinus TaxID=2653852 RepID=A0A6G8PSK3_9ACTN|nr:glucose 1-dehydrogenase [Rubrobacter marinus]
MRLENRVALVTGAGRGIGRAIALRLAEEGADVLATDIDPELAEETASAVRKIGREARATQVDVADPAQIKEVTAMAEQEFDAPLEIMVNNAGIQLLKEVFDVTPEEWDRIVDINARGVFFGMQAAANAMRERGRGTIINMASIAGREASPLYAPYCATKAAVISLTKSFALALAPYGIRVNSVGPGIVDTDLWDKQDAVLAQMKGLRKGEPKAQRIKQVPLGRAGVPEDVAGTVAFLASDDADYITGECILISGGLVML